MKSKILKLEFFDRNSVLVARDLLGKYLVRKTGNKVEKYKIIETEAYEGPEDKASHAHRGLTVRNIPMFGEPGMIYVYFTYGIHWMLNISCGRKGYPAAVLIRGLEDCVGPGRLTKKLKVDKKLNGKILGKKSGLWIEKHDSSKLKIIKTPRIGVDNSGPVWSKKMCRFVIQKTFADRVYDVVRQVPSGKTLTYKQVAKKAGKAKAYRAVGNILSRNYDPQIPCHRVVRSDGPIGGYNRGKDRKKELLKREFSSRKYK